MPDKRAADHFPVPMSKCPQCGHAMDRAGVLGTDAPAPPSADDFTLCIRCGAILQYDFGLRLVAPSEAALEALGREQPEEARMLLQAQRFIRTKLFSLPDPAGKA